MREKGRFPQPQVTKRRGPPHPRARSWPSSTRRNRRIRSAVRTTSGSGVRAAPQAKPCLWCSSCRHT